MGDLINPKNALLIQPYGQLSLDIKSQVDSVVEQFEAMSYHEIVAYGWGIASRKNEIVNQVLINSKDISYDSINKSLKQVMRARKTIMPQEESVFRKAYIPSAEDKVEFVEVVSLLEQAIQTKIQNMFELNQSYFELMWESKRIVDHYAIVIMAIDKYLADNPNTDLSDTLKEKRMSLLNSRRINVDTMLEYPILCYMNGRVINKLYTIINNDLHYLREQLLIQTGISEIRNILSACDGIKNSIATLSEQNKEDIKLTAEKFLQSEVSDDETQIEQKICSFNDSLSKLESLETIQLKQERVEKPVEEKTTNSNVISLTQSNAENYFAFDSSCVDLEHYVFIDKEKKKFIKEWAASAYAECRCEERFFILLKESLHMRYDFGISLILPSLDNNTIYFDSSASPAAFEIKDCEKIAKGIAKKWRSDIARYDEIILLYGYYFASGMLNYRRVADWLNYDNVLYDGRIGREDLVFGFNKRPMLTKSYVKLKTMIGMKSYSLKTNMISGKHDGKYSLPIVLYNMPKR